MAKKETTLRQQLEAFTQGQYLDSDGQESWCFNFYDWFCQDKSLKRKARKLFSKTRTFVRKFNIDLDSTYVFFKNNCPMGGSLYDDFRICDIKSGNVIYTVTPKCGHNGMAEIWGQENNFDGALYTADTLTDIYKSLEA